MRLDLFHTLRVRGWTGIGMAHVMGWFGSPNHTYPMTAYSSNNSITIGNQLSIMKACGVGGVILTWQGVTVSPFLHSVAIEMSQQCAERGMLFCLLLDPWICKTPVAGKTKEQVIAASLNDPTVQTIFNSPSYVPEKYILDFGTGANLQTLGQMFQTKIFLPQNTGFAWPPIQNAVAATAKMNALPTMEIPCLFSRFFDGGPVSTVTTLASAARGDAAGKDMNTSQWSRPGSNDCRMIETQAGTVALQAAASIPVGTKYAAYVTWNDYSERTEIESAMSLLTGIPLS
jgi:hypothetical protein